MMNTMGEVATLTDKLAMMPDNMLPRLAQQYKSDAITLSLILGEKNRRDRMRNSVKTQAGAQPQAKVNDQIVAGMQQLPEEVGIGALPAPNMQRMADGGIAGYDMSPDANSQLMYNNEPVMRMADGGVARYADEGLVNENPLAIGTFMRKWRESGKPLLPYLGIETTRPVDEGLYGTTPTGPSPSNAEIEAMLGLSAPAADGKAVPKAAAAPKTDTTGQGGLPDLTRAPAAQTQPAAPKVGDARAQFLKDAESMAPKTETAEDFAARRKTMLGDEGQALSKYEAKLLAQEAAAPREKDEAFWMAVTQAGLAAAAGKSQHALQNIAEGFGTGLAGYKDALKDFKKAEQERDRAMADIEKARRAEKRGDVDSAMAYEEKSKTRMDNHNHYKLSGLASLAGHEISGQYSLAGHQVSAAASRESTQAYRQAALEQRNMGLVENIRKNIEAKLANQFLADPVGLAAETERRLQIELQRYPGLAQYAGTPSGAAKFSPADQALVSKYATPPR